MLNPTTVSGVNQKGAKKSPEFPVDPLDYIAFRVAHRRKDCLYSLRDDPFTTLFTFNEYIIS